MESEGETQSSDHESRASVNQIVARIGSSRKLRHKGSTMSAYRAWRMINHKAISQVTRNIGRQVQHRLAGLSTNCRSARGCWLTPLLHPGTPKSRLPKAPATYSAWGTWQPPRLCTVGPRRNRGETGERESARSLHWTLTRAQLLLPFVHPGVRRRETT